eukprot:m.190980 g.190980  ORF g.190980 m.190980 type:complete len:185 (-) comp10589_c1_seq3:955-1509(-)
MTLPARVPISKGATNDCYSLNIHCRIAKGWEELGGVGRAWRIFTCLSRPFIMALVRTLTWALLAALIALLAVSDVAAQYSGGGGGGGYSGSSYYSYGRGSGSGTGGTAAGITVACVFGLICLCGLCIQCNKSKSSFNNARWVPRRFDNGPSTRSPCCLLFANLPLTAAPVPQPRSPGLARRQAR